MLLRTMCFSAALGVYMLGTGATAAAAEDLATDQPEGELEVVATFDGPMLTGVTVSPGGRIFVNFPRWGDRPDFTVGEIVDGKTVAYPDAAMNEFDPDQPGEHLLSVQSVVVGPDGRLWALDTANPKFEGVIPGGAKLVAFDLDTNRPVRTITFPDNVALPTTYLNDVRFDLTRDGGYAYITDSSSKGPNAIIVVDLADGSSRRVLNGHASVTAEGGFLPMVEGRPLMQNPGDKPPKHIAIGSDGIAISPDGQFLYYTPLAGRHLYRVPTEALRDASMSPEDVADAVEDLGNRGFASDGLETDAAGNLYLTDYEDNAVVVRSPKGDYTTLVHDPRLLWPDTLSVAADGHLYITANQLHRQKTYQDGEDRRVKPYVLFRTPIDVGPVDLSSGGR